MGQRSIRRNALGFDRQFLVDTSHLEKIRAAGNLAGRKPEEPTHHIQGWFEYDLDVPGRGWLNW